MTSHPDLIRRVVKKAAANLGCSEDEIRARMAHTIWRSPEGLLQREFHGLYRGYYPKSAMDDPVAAALAELFDLMAAGLGDPRRALRIPAASANGRTKNGI